jgi:hypothetical protein
VLFLKGFLHYGVKTEKAILKLNVQEISEEELMKKVIEIENAPKPVVCTVKR